MRRIMSHLLKPSACVILTHLNRNARLGTISGQQTFNELHSWCAMPHSSSLSSYWCRPAVLLLVTSSMAARYCNANSNISNVEFHRVDTSQGILHAASFVRSTDSNHAGDNSVVECMIKYVILCNCGYQVSEDIANKYSTIHLDEYKFDRVDTRIQGLTISHRERVSLINPAINIIVVIVITIIALSLYLCF
jgi:hypothetical protein